MKILLATAFSLILIPFQFVSAAVPSQPLPSDTQFFGLASQQAQSGGTARLFSSTLFADTISGTVFEDLSGNGLKDPSDPGVQNWRIRLFAASLEVDSTLSDASGNYEFVNLSPGTYTVSEAPQSGWRQTLPAADGSYTVSILDGQSIAGNDFGNFGDVTISGAKFNDLNGNGTRELNDPGLANWRIRLFVASLEVDSALTDVGGSYSFAHLGPGTYSVSEESQAGWTPTFPVSPPSYTVTPHSGQTIAGTDFGNFHIASISGTKFEDLNGNGVKEGGEPPLQNWRIRLFVASLEVDSTLTDVAGSYTFSNLGPGTYSVSEQAQGGWTQTLPASGAPYLVATQSGQNLSGKDFGNFRNGTITGMKFRDLNANGVKDGGESGLQNWRIRLFRANLEIDSALTDAGGTYTFINVGPGTVKVGEQLQPGWSQTLPGPPGTYTVALTSGQNLAGMDFGNFRTSGISGMVFYDRNDNGSFDVGEGGLTNWTINLAGTNPANDRTTLTQAGGFYNIQGLAPDTYTISLVVMPHWVQTYPPTTSYTLVVTTGLDTSGFDFGAASIADSTKFRSFPAESLYVRRAIPRRKVASRWCFDFTNTLTVTPVNGLHVVFGRPTDSVTVKGPFTTAVRLGAREYDFTGATITTSQSVEICGYGSRYGMVVRRWWWTFNGLMVGGKQSTFGPASLTFLLPMPNTANLRDEVMLQYFTTGITFGIPRPDAKRLYGWVVLPRSLSLYNSLVNRGVTHTGTPSGFVSYRGKAFVGKKILLYPSYLNDRLFADLAALKINIASSLLAHTPPGFGQLIYDDQSNPLSGLTLNQIAARTDSSLTFWVGVAPSVYLNLDTVIQKINRAFNGPRDTISFSNSLRFTGVASVSNIPFLRPGTSNQPVVEAPKTNLTEDRPSLFTLQQNYPNPFNPTTTIEFELSSPSFVTLKVYNILGQEVATLLDREMMEDGPADVEFDAGKLASGVYFYRLVAEGVPDGEPGTPPAMFISVKKMLLLK